MLSGAAISWKGNKQTCVALSTAEAEYVALSAAGQEALWLQQLVSDLLNTSIQETTLLEDNHAAICLEKISRFMEEPNISTQSTISSAAWSMLEKSG